MQLWLQIVMAPWAFMLGVMRSFDKQTAIAGRDWSRRRDHLRLVQGGRR